MSCYGRVCIEIGKGITGDDPTLILPFTRGIRTGEIDCMETRSASPPEMGEAERRISTTMNTAVSGT